MHTVFENGSPPLHSQSGCRPHHFAKPSHVHWMLGLFVVLLLSPYTLSAQAPSGYALGGDRLFSIDLQSLTLTEIGPLTTPPGTSVEGIAFHPDGRLLGLLNGTSSAIVEIDMVTAQVFQIASLPETLEQLQGLAIDACGRMWVNELDSQGTVPTATVFVYDSTNGDLLEQRSGAPVRGLAGFGDYPLALGSEGIHIANPDQSSWRLLTPITPNVLTTSEPIALNDDGTTLWGVIPGIFVIGPPIPAIVFSIDVDSGQVLLGTSGFHVVDSLALAPPPGTCSGSAVVDIPTLDGLSLALLALLLAAAGSVLLLRPSGARRKG